MKSTLRIFVVLPLSLVGLLARAEASGFAVFNQGARAAGMANAFVARASDPSSVWYNPAGILQLEGLQIYAGGQLALTGERQYYSVFRDRILAADPFLNVLPDIYISYRLTEAIGLGLSVTSPLNYEITWPQTPEVEHVVYIINSMKIRSLTVSPAVALRLGKNLSVGGGVSFSSYRFHLRYHYPFDSDVLVAILTNGEIMDTMDTVFDLQNLKARNVGYFAGLRWENASGLSFGATYRKGGPLTFDSGTVIAREPEISQAYARAVLEGLFPDSPEQSAAVLFSTVDQLSAGLAFAIGDSLELEFDVSWTLWSQMDTFKIEYAHETFFRSFWSGYYNIEASPDFKDTVSLQLGGEYRLSPELDLRCGVFSHGSLIKPSNLSPAFPLGPSMGFALGLGYHSRWFTVDAAYVLTFFPEIEDVNDSLFRWGDDAQKYPARIDHAVLLNTGLRF